MTFNPFHASSSGSNPTSHSFFYFFLIFYKMKEKLQLPGLEHKTCGDLKTLGVYNYHYTNQFLCIKLSINYIYNIFLFIFINLVLNRINRNRTEIFGFGFGSVLYLKSRFSVLNFYKPNKSVRFEIMPKTEPNRTDFSPIKYPNKILA